ncbi:high-affinity Zn(2+) transporter zrt1 [Coniosporium tulheliwenetii]|uniref:High-affinity Zn(2+) transporter zrt1 n=1 Tax=Coniosporium tulheliwenetii TaxID=3383036 RepID=A0ACC2YI70_9PEZI|nr:high-affinity Zn(2+) transporter zrt1 [Cladosporium sp. JES 115]
MKALSIAWQGLPSTKFLLRQQQLVNFLQNTPAVIRTARICPYCLTPDGGEVELVSGSTTTHEGEQHADPAQTPESTGQNCHFHAGVEHCVGEGESEDSHAVSCERSHRDYNVPLRIGLTFVMLATGAISVFTPILMSSFTHIQKSSLFFVLLKQFGTGVIVSTAFVHLLTHATLMFANDCLGELGYEATSAAIFMAGTFLSFLVEYLGMRFVSWRRTKSSGKQATDGEIVKPHEVEGSSEPIISRETTSGSNVGTMRRAQTPEKLSVLVMEAGIVFHSLLIGLTLVVAGDSFFLTLFAVIVFHQAFEGIALGTRIAELPSTKNTTDSGSHGRPVSLAFKLCMGLTFALITPIGMGIGIGVLDRFNGSDPATLVAIGTLDALSAGILAWVGLVEMWAHDWLHGELAYGSVARTTAGVARWLRGWRS